MPTPSHYVIFNASSGTALSTGIESDSLVARFAALGPDVHVDSDGDSPLAERLDRAKQSGAPVLVAAGGDGTVTAVATAAVEAGLQLAVLPLGTANLLARDLAIPLALDDWFDSFAAMVPRRMDVGEVNGRVFLHKVVIGAVPGIAAAREQIRDRNEIAAKLGFLMHFVRRLSRLRRFAAEITRTEGDPHIERVQSIAVANNSYDEAPGRIFARSRLDRGSLSLYLLRQLSLGDALRLGAEMVMGNWRGDAVLEIEKVTEVTVRMRRPLVRVMIDGEIEMLDSPLAFRTRPLALEVFAPPVVEAPAEEALPDAAAAAS